MKFILTAMLLSDLWLLNLSEWIKAKKPYVDVTHCFQLSALKAEDFHLRSRLFDKTQVVNVFLQVPFLEGVYSQ